MRVSTHSEEIQDLQIYLTVQPAFVAYFKNLVLALLFNEQFNLKLKIIKYSMES